MCQQWWNLDKNFRGAKLNLLDLIFFLIRKKTFIFSFHFLCLKQAHIIVEFKKTSPSFVIISYQIMSLVNVDAFFFHLYHKPFSLHKRINYFTLYHNLSNINLSLPTYLEKKDKIYIHKSQLSQCKT